MISLTLTLPPQSIAHLFHTIWNRYPHTPSLQPIESATTDRPDEILSLIQRMVKIRWWNLTETRILIESFAKLVCEKCESGLRSRVASLLDETGDVEMAHQGEERRQILDGSIIAPPNSPIHSNFEDDMVIDEQVVWTRIQSWEQRETFLEDVVRRVLIELDEACRKMSI